MSKEQTQPQRRYDAVFIHTLGTNVSGPQPYRLTPRSELINKAAVRLAGDDAYLLTSGSDFHGTGPIAFSVHDNLTFHHRIDTERIILSEKPPSTTSEELRFFRQQIQAHPEWQRVAHVSMDAHRPSMIALRRILPKEGVIVEFKTAEEVLPEHKDVFRKMHLSIGEAAWRLYELAKFPFLLFPAGERLLNKIATKWRPKVN